MCQRFRPSPPVFGLSAQVMIFGESSGAGCVSNHMVMPRSSGMFSRAGMQVVARYYSALHAYHRDHMRRAQHVRYIARFTKAAHCDLHHHSLTAAERDRNQPPTAAASVQPHHCSLLSCSLLSCSLLSPRSSTPSQMLRRHCTVRGVPVLAGQADGGARPKTPNQLYQRGCSVWGACANSEFRGARRPRSPSGTSSQTQLAASHVRTSRFAMSQGIFCFYF